MLYFETTFLCENELIIMNDRGNILLKFVFFFL